MYDTWQTNNEKFKTSKYLNHCLYGTKKYYLNGIDSCSIFIKNQLSKFRNKDGFYFLSTERKIINNEEKKEKKVYQKAKKDLVQRIDSHGIKYGYVEIKSKVSIVSKILLDEFDIEYLVIYVTYKKNDMKISLRSKTIDVSQIAIKFGGGGHCQAASFFFEDKNQLHDLMIGKFSLI